MNSKLKFYQSIKFKIALVFALMLMLTLECVGAVFVRQLEHQNLNTFKQTIELPSYVDNSLSEQLVNTNHKKANQKIRKILAEVNNNNISEIRVIDSQGVVRGTSNFDNRNMIGQKTTEQMVKATLVNNRSHTENVYDNSNHTRYYVNIIPLVDNSNNNVVGVVYLRASLESVYSNINSITLIYLSAALITIVIGLLLAIIISQEITRPIEEMRKQTLRIARGDFSGQVRVMGNDELGQLAGAVNNLSVRVEEAQESSDSERRRLDSVLSHMSDGVLATDRRGNVTIVNNMALQLLGVEHDDELIGKSIIDVLDIRHDYTVRQLVNSEQKEMILDMSNSGSNLILNAYFSPIQRESGFVSGLVCVLHDVTSQQKEEQERKEFVSNVSHELRTPLTSVKSYVEALSDGAWQDKEIAPQFLKVVQDETERMIRMINDLLSLSRMDAGTTKLNLEYVNINELFNYILNRFDMIIKKEEDPKKKKYTIERFFTKKDLWVEIDTDKFTQVIDNIMNNAIKYSPDGGVITARLLETHNHVIMSISDQGLGIPRKDLSHIFDRFFRVDKARSRKQGGTGLGLAISKEVVNMLGGQIWVDSVEGKGSTFYISLPYVPYEEGDEWDDQKDQN
ncbi:MULTISPECIES: cell wall metabolism sensor histidine kinase WalK [Limosilactobacillus]|uniref:histidine kinase n=1 Tax=Limosilactobacillus vaginalis DSM 5837 = ATCC 49540 TaxID=1423814 RepID=C2EU87_9LACO|nr:MULTISPECIES: cell wall metabolism sensor histidine kinase WalK [Limosilactobacillus]PEH04437.1 cell wall metabolism sensor histidine kinase WalK [Lactobacillus sp. UMNPBX5]EEJ40619.1 PAS domain S-box protein [Limosilactobacillus vaginalis DSM 5837 = ATCC 49540]MCI6853161.1 cell wall metabolism sensor histidine kinase WalK [Limosilactobacillus vaginalis]MCZ2464878.1 cell wall metabolism sensor histidine kinase WalK [Limosilactobacillus vaginalis]MDM8221803.1 cell wall metabolism sensor hist